MQQQKGFPLPSDLPRPVDDGAADHLWDIPMPQVSLHSTAGRMVDLSDLSAPRTVIYCYPMTGVPGKPLPEGWGLIPGARASQTTQYQREMASRLDLPFEILSDAEFKLCNALSLPTFKVDGMRLVKRLTMIVRGGRIEHVFYPVFPPNDSADQVIR